MWSQTLQFNHHTASVSSTLVLPGTLRPIRNLPLTSNAHAASTAASSPQGIRISQGYLDNFPYKLAQSLACRKTLCCSTKAPGNGESSQHPKISSSAR